MPCRGRGKRCERKKPTLKQHKISAMIHLVVGAIFMLFMTISVPVWHSMSFVAVTFNGPNLPTVAGVETASELRLGIWGYCVRANNTNQFECEPKVAYSIPLTVPATGQTGLVKSSWTQGLVVQAVAAGTVILAPFLIWYKDMTFIVVATVYGTFLAYIAYIIEIALLVLVQKEMRRLDVGADTSGGTAFWLMLDGIIPLTISSAVFWAIHRHVRLQAENPTTESPKSDEKSQVEKKVTPSTSSSSTTLHEEMKVLEV